MIAEFLTALFTGFAILGGLMLGVMLIAAAAFGDSGETKMDYSKKGNAGTTPEQLAAQAALTRAIGTGGGKSMAEMAENGAAREACVKNPHVPTPAALLKRAK